MEQEREAHERDDDAFLDQLFFECGDRAIDQAPCDRKHGVAHIRAAIPFIA